MKHELARSRQAEEALLGKLGQLTALIENLQMGVLVEDDARHVLHVNQKFCEMFGVKSASSVIGASCKEALDAVKSSVANSEEFLQSVEQRLAVREAVIGEKIVTAEGRVFERDYVPILIGEGQKGSLWLYRDATEPPKTARRATVY